MSQLEVLQKCNERNEIGDGSHFVLDNKLTTAPTIADCETNLNMSANAKVPSPCIKTPEVASSSRMSIDGARMTRKRKRGGHKDVTLSGDDSESGSGRVAQQSGQQNKGKKRPRRRKNRKYKPYNKLSWQERKEQDERETRRANLIRDQRFANGQPVAPYNTTQFLMEDHNDLKDIDVKPGPMSHYPALFPKQKARARDSSFSLDSDEDYYYSSPEDEKEFLTKEFSTAYEDLHAEQLNSQPKPKLVQDVLMLEKKVDVLEKELGEARGTRQDGGSENETDDRLILYKTEITKLTEENNSLRAENECLKRRCFTDKKELHHHSSSSIDSDSDSTASSSGSCTSSSCSSKEPVNTEENKNEPSVPEPTEKIETAEPSNSDQVSGKISELAVIASESASDGQQ